MFNSKVLSILLCRLLLESEGYGYIKWIDLSIVIVVMLTLALTAHAYLVRKKILGRAVASNMQTKVLDLVIFFTFVFYSHHKKRISYGHINIFFWLWSW